MQVTEISLSLQQLEWVKVLTYLRLNGIRIPEHTDALAHLCKVSNSHQFVEDLAVVWLCVYAA